MSFVVSSRKYRPQQFKTVKGQQHVITTLKNALKNKQLAQVFLFCGPKGTGKTTCARVLAKAINCTQLQATGEPCNTCRSCQNFQKQTSLNIHELDAASNNSVEDIRHLVEQVRYHATSGKKVFIIDEAHMLSKAAFNALLKTLEEPPKHVVFILATTEKYKIIPTILSRCQVFDFHRITPAQITSQLQYIAVQENIVCEEEALRLISHKAEGSLRDALSMFDLVVTFSANKKLTQEATLRHLHLLDHDYYFKVVVALCTGNIGDALLLYDEIVRLGFSGQDFVTGLSEHLRNLLVCQVADTLPLFNLATTTEQAYKTQAKQVSTSFLYKALELTHTCGLHYKNSQNKRLHIELMLVKVAQLVPTTQSSVSDVSIKSIPQTPITINQHTDNKITPSPTSDTFQKRTTETPTITTKSADTKPTPSATGDVAKKSTSQVPNVMTQSPKVAIETAQSLPKNPEAPHTTIPKAPASKGTNAFKPTIKVPTNIKAVEEAITQKDIQQASATTSITPATSPTNQPLPLDHKEVASHWRAYAKKFNSTDHPRVYAMMQQRIEVVGNTITIILSNPMQKRMLAQLKPDPLLYLRKKLNNQMVALDTSLQETPKSTTPHTNVEKLQYLTKKYPPIALLQKELALETL